MKIYKCTAKPSNSYQLFQLIYLENWCILWTTEILYWPF